MKLVLKNNDGESVTLIIRQDETFAQLRRRVEDEVGISIDMKDIALKGKRIDEDQKVLEYFVSCGDKSLLDEPEQACAVPGCNSTKLKDSGKTFFSFPQEEIRCHQWALYCQRLNMMSGKHRLDLNADSTICSDHFRPDQFVKNTTTLLKRTAVPCINPDLPVCDNAPPKRIATATTVNSKTRRKKSVPTNEHVNLMSLNDNCLNKAFQPSVLKEEVGDLICRLCARPSTDVIFIFDEIGIQMQIADKISVCLPISVKVTDPLPKQICRECYDELSHSYSLATTCLSAESKLKELKKEDHFRPIESEAVDPLKIDEPTENGDRSAGEASGFDVMPHPFGCPLCVDGKMTKTEVENHASEYGPNDEDIELDSNSIPLNGIANGKVEIEESKDGIIEDPSTGKSESDAENIDDEMRFSPNLQIEDSEYDGGESRGEDDLYVFSCRLCSADFRNYSAILQHALMHSDDGFYQCSLCDSYFSTQDDLEAHFTVHNPINRKMNSGQRFYRCQLCGIGFKTSVTWSNHICSNNRSILPTNKCKVCLKGFRSQSRLQFHMKFHKGAKQGYCEVCQKTFPDEVKLYKHTMYLHSTDKAHCCEECGKIFRSVSSLRYHQRSHQGEDIMKPFACDQCGKCFIRKSMLRNHIAAAHKNMSHEGSCYTCKLCHEAFPDTDSAVAHMENIHKSECNGEKSYSFEMLTITRLYMCEYCDRCFSETNHLNNHREQHRDDTPYQCKYCNESFASYGEHSEHKNSHEEVTLEYTNDFSVPTAYLCEYCDRSFVSHIKFSEHLTVHYGPAPYHCRYCPMKFATSSEAIQHRATHTEISANDEYNFYRPYECHYCNKSFAIEDALVKHIRMHTGEKPFICDQCGKGFSQSSGLYTHQKVHSNERPYTCPLCPRTFKIKGDRDVHVRKHSGDRPYKCEFCGKAFMTQHVYSQHRKIHTGERPYKCDVCGIAFRRSHVLTVHKRIHTGEKPNVCDICGKRYRQKGDMLKHRRIQHGFVKVKLQKIEY